MDQLLGLPPYEVWKKKVERERVIEILKAMRRYADADKAPDVDWILELHTLLGHHESEYNNKRTTPR